MSAVLQDTGAAAAAGPANIPANRFTAHLTLASGVSVSIHALSLATLQATVSKLQPTEAANEAPAKPADKQAATPAPTPVPQAAAGNASASTGTQASAPPAASGSAAAGEGTTYTYDHVKDRVLKLSKVKRELAIEVLGAFKTVGGDKVDHGNKLQLPDYPAFIAAADAKLEAAGAKA